MFAMLSIAVLAAEAPGAAPPVPRPDPAALVGQLGSERYEKRLAAQGALRDLGVRAAPALEAGLADADLEVRRRCESLLKKVRADLCARRLRALRAGRPDGGVALWDHFRRMFGSGTVAMAYFADMYEKEGELFEEVAAALRRRDHRGASRLHQSQVEKLTGGRLPARPGTRPPELPPEDHPRIAAALFVGVLPGVRLADEGGTA